MAGPIYVKILEAEVTSTEELTPGLVFIDRDATGFIVGIEVIECREVFVKGESLKELTDDR